jgi:hypothetical protein
MNVGVGDSGVRWRSSALVLVAGAVWRRWANAQGRSVAPLATVVSRRPKDTWISASAWLT